MSHPYFYDAMTLIYSWLSVYSKCVHKELQEATGWWYPKRPRALDHAALAITGHATVIADDHDRAGVVSLQEVVKKSSANIIKQ